MTNESGTPKLISTKLKQLKRGKPIGILSSSSHASKPHLSAFLPNLFKDTRLLSQVCMVGHAEIKLNKRCLLYVLSKTQVYCNTSGAQLKKSENLISWKLTLTRTIYLDRWHVVSLGDQAAETFCIRHGITPYKIFYEDLLDEMYLERNIAKLLDFLSIRYKLPLSLNSSTKMQRTKNSTELYP